MRKRRDELKYTFYCKMCGEQFPARRKNALYCGNKCACKASRLTQKASKRQTKQAASHKQTRHQHGKNYCELVTCPGCKLTFLSDDPRRKYHNNACKMRAYRARKEEKARVLEYVQVLPYTDNQMAAR